MEKLSGEHAVNNSHGNVAVGATRGVVLPTRALRTNTNTNSHNNNHGNGDFRARASSQLVLSSERIAREAERRKVNLTVFAVLCMKKNSWNRW